MRLVLGSPSLLPSSALPLHALLASSFGPTGVLAAAEILSRSDDLLSCKLQSLTISETEARSSLARAMYISVDSITYMASSARAVDNCFAALPKVSPIEGGISDHRIAYARAFRCFKSAVIDMATQLGVHQYFANYGTQIGDELNFINSMTKFFSFPPMEPPGGFWRAHGAGVQTDITAYPFLLGRYATTALLLTDQARSVFQHVMETITYDNKVWDLATFEENYPQVFEQAADYLRQAKFKVAEFNPTFACDLPSMVTRFYTLSCILMTLRSGFVALESLLATNQFGNAILVPVVIDALPHVGGAYGAARETADRIINSGPNGLAGASNIWITHLEGITPSPPVIDVPDDDVADVPVNVDSVPAIPPVIPDGIGPSNMLATTEDKRQKRKEGWSFLITSLKVPNSKFRLPDKSAPQCEWQDWKQTLLQFDKQWYVETASSIQAILANVKNTDTRVHGWSEISNKYFRRNEPVSMAKFVDHVLRQVICTVTTRKTAWAQLQTLSKTFKSINDCHVLSVKLQQLLADIFPSSSWTSDLEAAPCTHRDIVLVVYQLTIAMKSADRSTIIGKSWNLHDSYCYSDMFSKYVDAALHHDQKSSKKLCSEYIAMLVKAMDAAHREYSQVIQSEHTQKSVVATVQRKSSRGRSHSVQAFDTRQHDADHNSRKRSAQPNWQSNSPSTRGGRGSRGASASRGNGRSASQGRSNPGSAEEPSDKNLASEIFTKIGNMFSKSDPDLLIPGIQNMAYKTNQKTLSQCRKDLGRGNCVLCLAGKHPPQKCYLLTAAKAHTEEGKMAHRFMAKWDA